MTKVLTGPTAVAQMNGAHGDLPIAILTGTTLTAALCAPIALLMARPNDTQPLRKQLKADLAISGQHVLAAASFITEQTDKDMVVKAFDLGGVHAYGGSGSAKASGIQKDQTLINVHKVFGVLDGQVGKTKGKLGTKIIAAIDEAPQMFVATAHQGGLGTPAHRAMGD